MPSNVATRNRKATVTIIDTLTLPLGTLHINTSTFVCVVHDGETPGGWAMSRYDHTHPDATESVPGFLSAADKTKLDALSTAGGYTTIDNNDTPLPVESTLNFLTDFTVVDNPGLGTTDVSLSNAFTNAQLTQFLAYMIALS